VVKVVTDRGDCGEKEEKKEEKMNGGKMGGARGSASGCASGCANDGAVGVGCVNGGGSGVQVVVSVANGNGYVSGGMKFDPSTSIHATHLLTLAWEKIPLVLEARTPDSSTV
jgi:hypothetical protein